MVSIMKSVMLIALVAAASLVVLPQAQAQFGCEIDSAESPQ